MQTIRVLVILCFLVAMSAAALAQSDLISVGVSVSCSSISVSLDSDYARAIKAQVYAGTGGLTEWDLVGDIGEYTRANANGTGSRSYAFPTQRANTVIFYSIRVYDNVTSALLETAEGSRDCDGTANNTPTTTATPRPSATPTPSTGSGSSSCNNIPANARGVHIVQAGENLFRIGLRYGVHFTRLATYNGIADPALIYVGQCIAIPPA